MAYRSRLVMGERWVRLRELADGTRTRMECAAILDMTSDMLGRWVKRRAEPGILFLATRMGRPITKHPVIDPDALDLKALESDTATRCKCGLVLPCNSCVGTITDYMSGNGDHVMRRGDGMRGNGLHG